MPHRATRALYVAVVAGALAASPAAGARNDVRKVYRDCLAHGKLTHHYSRRTLKQAKKHLPPSLRDYAACSRAINRALKGKRHKRV